MKLGNQLSKHLLVLPLLFGSALTAFGGGQTSDTLTIDFNGKTTQFSPVPRPIHYKGRIYVRLQHINSFTYAYSVAGTNVDYHLSATPSALAGFVGFGMAATAPAAADVRLQENGALPPTYLGLLRAFFRAVKENQFGDIRGIDPSDSDRFLVSAYDQIAYDPTNEDSAIQAKALDKTQRVCGGTDSHLTAIVANRIRKPFDEKAKRIDQAFSALVAEYQSELASGTGLPPSTLAAYEQQAQAALDTTNAQFKAADALISKVEAYAAEIELAANQTKDGVVLGPVVAGGDEVEVRLTRTLTDDYAAKLKKPGNPNPKPSDTYLAIVSEFGRPVVDFSFGAIYTTLKDTNYVSDVSGNVTRGANAGYDGQAGVLAHWYRTPGPYRFMNGPTLGLTASSSEPRVLVGWSAGYDARQMRVFLSAGLAFGKVQVLNNIVGMTPSPTVSVNRGGLFIGLTAAFFGH